MKWGKLGGFALFCIAFSLIAPAVASAAINIVVDYPAGGEQISTRYLDINWTTSGCNGTSQISVYYDINNNFADGATVIKTGEADDGNYIWDLLGVQPKEFYVAARQSCSDPYEIVVNYSAGRITKLGYNISYTSNGFNVTVNATSPPSIVYIAPDSNQYVRGKQIIVFNVSEPDNESVYGSIYYSSSRGGFENAIAENIDMENHCTDEDNATSTPNNCTYVWGTAGIEGDYYIDIIVTDGIYNDTNSSVSTVNVTNSLSTAEVLYPNGGESTNERYIDINWTASDIPGFSITGADIYYDEDGNLLTGRTLLSANETGNYTWDLYGLSSGKYYACINAYSSGLDNLSNSITLSDYDCSDSYFTYEGIPKSYSSNSMHSIVSANSIPNITFTYPNSGSFTTNITIMFNASDEDGDQISAGIYYSASQGGFENIIAQNIDISDSSYCTDNDANTTTPNNCSYFWDTSALNANYFIDIIVYDGLDSANDSSGNALSIDNLPIISNLSISNTTTSSTFITWLTNEPANSTVYYWINSTLNYTFANSSYVTSHNITLKSLTGNLVYYYQAESCDTGGNCISSGVGNFSTLNTPPSANVTYPNGGEVLTSRYVSINWTAADSDGDAINISIYYDINNIAGDGRALIAANITNTGNYTWDIMIIDKGSYYISIDAISYDSLNSTYIKATDYSDASFAKGDIPFQYSSSQMHSVVSANNVPNATITYPNSGSFTTNVTILFNVSDADGDHMKASIYYSTSKGGLENLIIADIDLSNSSYCTDNDASTSTPNNCSYYWESAGLNADYYVEVLVNDTIDAGNDSSNSAITIDNIPVISNISAANTTTNSTTITWLTNEPANSTVYYWINSTLNLTETSAAYATSRSINLTGLIGNKVYYYQAESCDSTGKCIKSQKLNFSTINNAPVLNVVYPNGGETISTTFVSINWTAADPDEELLISIYYDINNNPSDGRTLIASNVENTGNYTWNSAGVDPGSYKILIEAQQYDYCNATTITARDYSDGYFTKEAVQLQYSSSQMHSVVSTNDAPFVDLTSPNERMVFRDTVNLKFNVSDNNTNDDLFIHSFTLLGEVYKRRITVNNSNDFDLFNYPVNITIDTFLLAQQDKMRKDGKKVRITVGGEEVSWYNSTPFNNVRTTIWFPVNITRRTVRDDIYIVYGRDAFVSLDRLEAPWENFRSKQNLVLNRPVDSVTENPTYPATKSNDGSYTTKWQGTNYNLSLNESLEFLRYTLAGASRAYKVHYRLTGAGIETVNSVFVTSSGNTTRQHVFNSSITSFTDYFEPMPVSEFVVDVRSIITHPEFYEVEVHEPVLLGVSMGAEENATQIVDAEYAYVGGGACTDPDNNLSTQNNCTFSFSSGNADGIYTLCINITDGMDFAYDCSAETIVINTLNVPPNMSAVLVTSSNGTNTEEENLTCWANATDPDEDDFAFEGFWYRNGAQNFSFTTYPSLNMSGDWVNVSTLDKRYTDVGENWSCYVRAYDLRAYSDYMMSSNLTMIYGPVYPVINWVNHTPDYAEQGGYVTINADIYDDNGQGNIAAVYAGVTPSALGYEQNFTMSHIDAYTWSFNFTLFHNGTYNYTVYAIDAENLRDSMDGNSTFYTLGRYAYVNIKTDEDAYDSGDVVNITGSD